MQVYGIGYIDLEDEFKVVFFITSDVSGVIWKQILAI